MRSTRRLTVGLLLALTGLFLFAAPASAHTGFESSDPADGAVLDAPVDVITLVFTGPAEPTGDGFQVLDPSGELRQPTEATTDDGSAWVLRFDPPIAGGAVGVRWMVKAPDAHPIDGSFSFTVPAVPPPLVEEDPTPTAAGEDPAPKAVEEDPTPEAASARADRSRTQPLRCRPRSVPGNRGRPDGDGAPGGRCRAGHRAGRDTARRRRPRLRRGRPAW